MSSDPAPALVLANVSKAYLRYARPIDRLKDLVLPGPRRGQPFWALKDVSFTVPPGQTVGIVGRNGSGKSTLLQIIARTLSPTAGQVLVRGRVSALLELGSGFNPDFTGRENVHFQASLMGLTSEEIEAGFDRIVAFAGIGDFLDQPVRIYSSGMFLRLAFAVAVSVEPDVLIVDEALSVGDEAFQRKCFSRIRSMREAGRTILFVSHSGGTVVDLCDQAILLDQGEMLMGGPPKAVVARYHRLIFAAAEEQERLRAEIRDGKALAEPPAGAAEPAAPAAAALDHYDSALVTSSALAYVPRGADIESPRLLSEAGRPVNLLRRRGTYVYTYRVRFSRPAFKVRFGMLIKTVTGFELAGAVSHPWSAGLDHVEAGQRVEVRFRFCCLLQPGTYFMNAGALGLVDGEEVFLDRRIDVLAFRVQPEPNDLATGVTDILAEPTVSLIAETDPKPSEAF
jgi:lipopolysaccharide transport system ATP-binding protein